MFGIDTCEACTHCRRCGTRHCLENEATCPDCTVHCGRLDPHDEHTWTTHFPRYPGPRTTYQCTGSVEIEGGHFGGAVA
jgi:hypothetical protein